MKTQIVTMAVKQEAIEKEQNESQKKISDITKKLKKSAERNDKLVV